MTPWVLVLVFAMSATVPAITQRTPRVIDISRMQPGAAPRYFAFTLTGDGPVSAWKVVTDPTAVGQKAIAQTSADKMDDRYPLAVYQSVTAANVEVNVHFKPVAGEVDQAGGIAVRLATPHDYYVVCANALENSVRFYRVKHGDRQQIQGINTEIAANRWHSLGLRAMGDRFTITFDGEPLFTAEDKSLTEPGKVALRTKADSVTHFDAISITPLD